MAGGEVCYWRSPAGTRARGGALPFYSCSEGGRSWAHASWGEGRLVQLGQGRAVTGEGVGVASRGRGGARVELR